MGVFVGVLISRVISNRERNKSLVDTVGKLTLFLTYALVFVIGLRVSQILPEVLTKGQQIVLALVAFSVTPALLSLVISYLMSRS